MPRTWTLRADMFDEPVDPALLGRARDLSPLLDVDERVERVALATGPRLTLLVLSERYFYVASEGGDVISQDGKPRSEVTGRVDGETLVVRHLRLGHEQRYDGLLPASNLRRFSDELHRPFTVEDALSVQRRARSAAALRW